MHFVRLETKCFHLRIIFSRGQYNSRLLWTHPKQKLFDPRKINLEVVKPFLDRKRGCCRLIMLISDLKYIQRMHFSALTDNLGTSLNCWFYKKFLNSGVCWLVDLKFCFKYLKMIPSRTPENSKNDSIFFYSKFRTFLIKTPRWVYKMCRFVCYPNIWFVGLPGCVDMWKLCPGTLQDSNLQMYFF